MRRKTPKTCDEGYFVCRYCSGFGYQIVKKTSLFFNQKIIKRICNCCDGTGQVDWIEHTTNYKYNQAVAFRKKELDVQKNMREMFNSIGTAKTFVTRAYVKNQFAPHHKSSI